MLSEPLRYSKLVPKTYDFRAECLTWYFWRKVASAQNGRKRDQFDFGSRQNLEGRQTAYDFRAECLTWYFWRIISDSSEGETRHVATDKSQTNFDFGSRQNLEGRQSGNSQMTFLKPLSHPFARACPVDQMSSSVLK